jgi:hypothetical protein
MYSLHSWFGMTTSISLVLQWIYSIIRFVRPRSTVAERRQTKSKLRILESFALVAGTIAIATGIMELVLCRLSSPEKSYEQFHPEGIVLNLLTISIIGAVSVLFYVLNQQRSSDATHQF